MGKWRAPSAEAKIMLRGGTDAGIPTTVEIVFDSTGMTRRSMRSKL